MADFPTSVYAPAAKAAGQTITAAMFNDPDAEIAAIEDGYRNATAPLNSSGSTVVTLSVTGGQITFPAVAVPSTDAHTLDEYCESTWTPVGNGATLTSPYGFAVKTGRVVTAPFQFTMPSTNSTTPARILGLPYKGAVETGSPSPGGGFITRTNSTHPIQLYMPSGSTFVDIYCPSSQLTNADLSGAAIFGVLMYRASS